MSGESKSPVKFISLFETKSHRVKSVSFHPTRSWVLAALHSGVIQLWDYRSKVLLEKFDGHKGPVRSVAFHPSQPIFVSGGNDCKIRVWNYKEKRCLFTLNGHIDFVRHVEFHTEAPWILSCSDDLSIRIWNWQSRSPMTELKGHTHYVMSARFHPTEDLIVSGSLDTTVCVWDISGLRKKSFIGGRSEMPTELFGNMDGLLKFKLEGHDRGVNWVAFHPSSPLILSASDDRHVKIWRISENKAWEVDTLRGHYNNVSCCLFAPFSDHIITDSEDKSLRIWDVSKRSLLHIYRREKDRFWTVNSHPKKAIFAAGHESGLIVFKLQRERPAYATSDDKNIYYIKEKYLNIANIQNSRDLSLLPIKSGSGVMRYLYHLQNYILGQYDSGSYEIYDIKSKTISSKGHGRSVAWATRNRIAVLDSDNIISIRSIEGDKKMEIRKQEQIKRVFGYTSGYLFIKTSSKLVLFDIQKMAEIGEMKCIDDIKDIVILNSNMLSNFAILYSNSVSIVNAKLQVLGSSMSERFNIKSGAWNDKGIFVYSTTSHVKYLLTNGDHGVIRSLEQPIYIAASIGPKLYFFTRDKKFRTANIDNTEMIFKHAIVTDNFEEVHSIIKNSKLVGQSIVSYLSQKGYPNIALHFVEDEEVRFELAIQSSNLDVAFESAKKINNNEKWVQLAQIAMKLGNHSIAEYAFNRTHDVERQSFLYLVTGRMDALKRLQRNDKLTTEELMTQFHISYYLNDIKSRIKILEQHGQYPLALMCAKTNGLNDDVERLARKLLSQQQSTRKQENLAESNETVDSIIAKLTPLGSLDIETPLLDAKDSDDNWPLLTVGLDAFESYIRGESKQGNINFVAPVDVEDAWGDDIEITDKTSEQPLESKVLEEEDNEWDLDIDIDPSILETIKSKVQGKVSIPLPKEGPHWSSLWCINSDRASDHVSSGSFDTAMEILHKQHGIINFAPLKKFFLNLLRTSTVQLQLLPTTSSITTYLQRNWKKSNVSEGLPHNYLHISSLADELQIAYKHFTGGKFQESLDSFRHILQASCLVSIQTKQEQEEVKELISISAEYISGLLVEIYRKEQLTNNGFSPRIAELAAYFSHCELQPGHQQLTIRSAMTIFYKLKNFMGAYNFAKKLLSLAPKQDVVVKTKQVMALCEQNGLMDDVKIDYDERNPFTVCTYSFKPIYKGNPYVLCKYCKSLYAPQYKDEVCAVCQLGKLTPRK